MDLAHERDPAESTLISRALSTTGGALHYADFGGDGPTVVLVHGLGGSHANWLAVAADLSLRSRVYALNVPPEVVKANVAMAAERTSMPWVDLAFAQATRSLLAQLLFGRKVRRALRQPGHRRSSSTERTTAWSTCEP